jgi:ribosomal protein S18 acetylase RimI-like enzyme
MARRALTGGAATPPAPRVRKTARAEDVAAVRELAARTGVFYAEECDVAAELVDERLKRGAASGYFFAFAEVKRGAGRPALVGYAAWGPVPMTQGSFDLYWIIVDPAYQGQGLGRRLLAAAEQSARSRGGRRLYIETSSRDRYARTRRFYRRAGYAREARLTDFYAPRDDKVIFCKMLI